MKLAARDVGDVPQTVEGRRAVNAVDCRVVVDRDETAGFGPSS
jgi:hypothetical protein